MPMAPVRQLLLLADLGRRPPAKSARPQKLARALCMCIGVQCWKDSHASKRGIPCIKILMNPRALWSYFTLLIMALRRPA